MPACDGHPASQPHSHVAVASTRYAYLRRAIKMKWSLSRRKAHL